MNTLKLPYERSDLVLPEFLNTQEKWDFAVECTTNFDRFDGLAYRVIDESVHICDAYKILKLLQHDINKKHEKEDICCVMDLIEGLINHLTKVMKQFKDKDE